MVGRPKGFKCTEETKLRMRKTQRERMGNVIKNRIIERNKDVGDKNGRLD
jgi:hypothetical protein